MSFYTFQKSLMYYKFLLEISQRYHKSYYIRLQIDKWDTRIT